MEPHEEQQGSDATIYDVARVAGVSPSTVSRAFSRPGRVSTQTAERIRKVAEEIGYRTKEVSRTLARTQRKVIGLAVADITNPFNFRVIRGCETAANQAGFIITVCDSQENESLERELLKRHLEFVDGLIITSSRLSDTEIRTMAKTTPTVVLNRPVAGLPCIVPDMAGGSRMAVDLLVELGHRSIGYLAGPETSWADGMRWRAIRESAAKLGFQEARLGPFPPTIQGGRAAAQTVASRMCHAVITYNDVMAIGLIQGLRDLGIRVPDDVSVIGFDNIFASDLVTPALTTVAAPLAMMGDTAVKSIIAALGGPKPAQAMPSTVPVKLILRESTGPRT